MLLSGAMGPDPSDRRLREDDEVTVNVARTVWLFRHAESGID